MKRDLALIEDAAREVGVLARKLKAEGLKVWSKDGGSPVTNADIAVDTLLRERLGAARADYGWLSEETADDPARMDRSRLFVVDPIDGTVAFFKEKPFWAVSIAVVEDGQPVAGVVHAPELEETFTALVGGGAFLNGAPIAASGCDAVEGCGMLGDGPMFRHPAWPTPWPDMRIETRNSIAYRMCLVAEGRFDAAIALTAKNEWDLAAADLICREAGAIVTDHKGRTFGYNRPIPKEPSLICAAPALHPLILDRVRHIERPN
ncbi:MAG TPA: 3'(2'),5'-bisphosphate nucleotidase CysQ [Caulobacter sp.]|nr:3'(2'),5'-bisphosphate nucleotidase CysQ [Caulobacter sp.]